MKRTYSFFYYWFPVAFYSAIIFIQSGFPTLKDIPEIPHMDKCLHFIGYALLGLLYIRGFHNSRFCNSYRFMVSASIFLTALSGVIDELHQEFVSHRTGDIRDIFFDALGGIFGVVTYRILTRKYPKIGRV